MVLLDARGASKVRGLATGFKSLQYDVFTVADGDAQNDFSDQDAATLLNQGIAVVMWTGQLALEQRAMLDLPWANVLASVELAQELGFPVRDNICSKLNGQLDGDIKHWKESLDLRKAIGSAAKSSSWFKSIADGGKWVEVIYSAFANAEFKQKELATKLSQLRAWVDNG